jgi:hypothetical protein
MLFFFVGSIFLSTLYAIKPKCPCSLHRQHLFSLDHVNRDDSNRLGVDRDEVYAFNSAGKTTTIFSPNLDESSGSHPAQGTSPRTT